MQTNSNVFRSLSTLVLWIFCLSAQAQNLVTYAGGTGKEVFYDAHRLSDGKYLVGGYAEDLGWVDGSVPRQALSPLGIKNANGTGKIGFVLHLSDDLQTILRVLYFPKGAVEDVRFIKASNVPGQATGSVLISGNTNDTKANNGGYFIAKLNNNFVSGIPTDLAWAVPVWAVDYPKTYHPWDVGADGKVVYVLGQTHSYEWAEARRLNANGQDEVVPNWRYHKLTSGAEYAGLAAAAPGGAAAIRYSSIIFKRAGRCDLRSWTQADYSLVQPDGNGGTKQGKWPLDVFYSGPGDPATGGGAGGKGYTGYSNAATFVYGPSAVVIDRRNSHIYLGMNAKSVLPGGEPDFEPAVIAYDQTGELKWWSRLYHEIQPNGTLVNSTPDQYIDDLAVDYSQAGATAALVVLARSHGNNVENLWEGNTVAANPGASGFQNSFTGNNGNIHFSWLGKLQLADGTLRHSTYVAEFNEGANNYGPASTDPNLDGWPSPNSGWANLNTTRCKDVQVAADGSVCVTCTGRKTITTAGAFQKSAKPGQGTTPWNNFVRVYKPDLSSLTYSSLLTGTFDPATGAGGGNTELYGVLPVAGGVVALGVHNEDKNSPGTAAGNAVPTTRVPAWGSAAPAGQSALLAYLTTTATSVAPPVTPPVPAGAGTGLTATYFDNQDFTGTSVSRTDTVVNFNWGNGTPNSAIGGNTFSARWRGRVQARHSEVYSFYTNADDGVRLKVNGVQVTNDWSDHGPRETSGTLALQAGQQYDIELDFFENSGGAQVQLSWSSASQPKQLVPKGNLYPTTAGTVARAAAPTLASAAPAEAAPGEPLSAYPNPNPDGRATLVLDAQTAQTAQVLVRDARGQLVGRFGVRLPAGKTEQLLPVTLSAGTYYLQTTVDGQVQKFTLRVR